MVLLRSLLPILSLGLVLSACGDEQAKAEPAAEVELLADPFADPTLARDAKLSPDLQDPFEKHEGAGETGEHDSRGGLEKFGVARCKGGVSEREIPAQPAERSKQPSPDLENPFKK